MRFDDFLETRIGGFGKYQYLVMLILGIEEIFIAFQVMGPVFLAATPKNYWCKHPQVHNDTIFGDCSLEERLRLTVPPDLDNDDVMPGNLGLAHCQVYNVEFPPGSCQTGDGSNVTGGGKAAMTALDATRYETSTKASGNNDLIQDCDDWIFDKSIFSSTIVTEWKFVCSSYRRGQAKSIAAIFLAGRAVGNFIFGWIADRYGRRPVFLVGGVLNVVTALTAAFVPTYFPFLLLRFVQAMMATGKTNTGFILALEFSPPSKRVVVGTVYFVFWSAGMCSLVGVAYLIRDWRHLLIAVTVPEILVYIVFYFTFPESPRWLYTQNRRDEADETLKKIAAVNRVDLPKELDIDETSEKNSTSPLDLVRTPQIRRVTFVMLFVWAVCGVSYYAFNFSTGDLGSNIFLTTLISSGLEVPACLVIIPLFAYGGRIPTFVSFMLATSLTILVSIAISNDASLYWLFLSLVMLGKFTLTVAFNMAWIYCGECYPTSIRSMGLTWTAVGARVTSPLGPFLVMLGAYYQHLPSLVIGGLALVGGLVILLLPETRNKPMVQTIEDGEEAIRQNRINFSCRQRKGTKHNNNKAMYEVEGAELLSTATPHVGHNGDTFPNKSM